MTSNIKKWKKKIALRIFTINLENVTVAVDDVKKNLNITKSNINQQNGQ